MMTNPTNQKTMLHSFNEQEKKLIETFKLHPLFQKIQAMEWDQFTDILIQRRFFSLYIVNTYELVIDLLEDTKVKKTVREILHEEYPRTSKGLPLFSHRELLFQDLLNLGASKEKILTTPETEVTKNIREEGLKLFSANNLNDESFQAVLIAAIRFWGEVMVGIEYQCLWPKISEKLSSSSHENNKKRSEFYYFHIIHDDRRSDIGENPLFGGNTHSQKLATHLAKLINSEQDLQACIEIEEKIYQLKYQFYDQFM